MKHLPIPFFLVLLSVCDVQAGPLLSSSCKKTNSSQEIKTIQGVELKPITIDLQKHAYPTPVNTFYDKLIRFDNMPRTEGKNNYGSGPNLNYKALSKKTVPRHALKIFDGLLLIKNHFEGGGELIYEDKYGNFTLLVSDTIKGVYHMSFGYFVLSGFSHLSFNNGSVYLLSRDSCDTVKAKKIYNLPGAPGATWFLEDESLFIKTGSGCVAIDKEGGMTNVSCEPKWEVPESERCNRRHQLCISNSEWIVRSVKEQIKIECESFVILSDNCEYNKRELKKSTQGYRE